MKTTEQLINNIIGQLKGVNKMLNEEKDCFKILVQMKAAKAAINAVMNKYIEENLKICLRQNRRSGQNQEKIKKLFAEIVKNN